MMPVEQLRRNLSAIGLDLSLPPWPKYLAAHARRRAAEKDAGRGADRPTAGCHGCRLGTAPEQIHDQPNDKDN